MMSSSYCWSCFSRLRPAPRPLLPQPHTSSPQAAPFHSTAIRHAMPPKKSNKQMNTPKFREARAVRADKKPKPAVPHRLSPEEIESSRKPVMLSNPNAVEVPEMSTLSTTNMVDPSSRGTMLSLPLPILEDMRALRVFHRKHDWNLFKRPATFMREETMELGKLIQGITENEDMKGKYAAKVVTGRRNTGKTIHLLQAVAMAMLHKWVVINIPNAQEYVSGTTAYAPLRGTDPPEYVQKNATSSLLESIEGGNHAVLENLHVSQRHPQFIADNPRMSLNSLVKMGVTHPEHSWSIFQALWKELTATSPAPDVKGTQPFKPRPPMLIAVDNLSHWMVNSEYRSASFEPIHAHDLSLVKHFLSLMSSPNVLPNGGLAMYATSTCNSPSSPALSISLEQLAARNAGVDPSSDDFPLPSPYEIPDSRTMSFFNDAYSRKDLTLDVLELSGIPRDDTRALLEYYVRSGLTQERVSEDFVGEKWTLSGGGVIGELSRLGKRVRALP